MFFRKLVITLPVVLLYHTTLPALAETFTSVQDGVWSAGTTWGKDRSPGAGDLVVCNHHITVDTNAEAGTQPATGGAPAVTIGLAGRLTIASKQKLIARGDVQGITVYGTGDQVPKFSMEPGSILEFDVPAAQVYYLRVGSAAYGNARWTAVCSPTAWCEIRRAGAGTAAIDGTYVPDKSYTLRGAGQLEARYVRFTELGSSTVPALETDARTSFGVILDNAIFNESGSIIISPNYLVPAPLLLNEVRTEGASPGLVAINGIGDPSHQIRHITRSSFGGGLGINMAENFVIEDNVFNTLGLRYYIGDTSSPVRSFRRNVIFFPGELNLPVTVEDSYLVLTESSANPHFVFDTRGARNNLIEAPVATLALDIGDVFMSFPRSGDYVGNILIPIATGSAAGFAPGNFLNFLNNGMYFRDAIIVADHNTIIGPSGNVAIGEANAVMWPGMLASLKSNLFANFLPAQRTGKFHQYKEGVVNPILPGAADYNAGFNMSPGTLGKGYSFTLEGEAPGAHDVDDQDPRFIDPTRNILTWGQRLHGTDGSLEQARDLLLRDPFLLAELTTWVRAGFAPTNPALKAAHDTDYGGWIGAVEGVPPPSTYILSGSEVGALGEKVVLTVALAPDASLQTPVKLVLSDGGLQGSFEPTSPEFSQTTRTVTIRYTPRQLGVTFITAENLGSLQPPPPHRIEVKGKPEPPQNLRLP